jgi:hypothetical protein
MSNHEHVSKELENEFFAEIERVQKDVHHFIDNLTAISGYAQLLQLRPERSVTELPKIIYTVEKSMQMLRACMLSLKEFENRHRDQRNTIAALPDAPP